VEGGVVNKIDYAKHQDSMLQAALVRSASNSREVDQSLRLQSYGFSFDCRFDAEGRCKRKLYVNRKHRAMNCCHSCYDSVGYLGDQLYNKEEQQTILALFKPMIGFWRQGRGCVLPRRLRSITCLGYNCNPMPTASEWMRQSDSSLFRILRGEEA
jgi:hypothetical protein